MYSWELITHAVFSSARAISGLLLSGAPDEATGVSETNDSVGTSETQPATTGMSTIPTVARKYLDRRMAARVSPLQAHADEIGKALASIRGVVWTSK